MGEEIFQLHFATPIYATCSMSLYKARQETSSKRLVLDSLLSLLVLNRIIFPCWCFTNLKFKILPWQLNKMVTGEKPIIWVDNHLMIITTKYGSHHFTGYGEKAI